MRTFTPAGKCLHANFQSPSQVCTQPLGSLHANFHCLVRNELKKHLKNQRATLKKCFTIFSSMFVIRWDVRAASLIIWTRPKLNQNPLFDLRRRFALKLAKIPNNHHRGTCTRKSIHIRPHIHIHTLTHLHTSQKTTHTRTHETTMAGTWAKVHDMAPKGGSKTAKDKSAARSAGSACRTLINPCGVYVPRYSRIISARCYWSCFCFCCYWLAPSAPERRLRSKQHRSSYFHATFKVHALTCMICGQAVKSGFQALLKAPLAGARRAMLWDPAPATVDVAAHGA